MSCIEIACKPVRPDSPVDELRALAADNLMVSLVIIVETPVRLQHFLHALCGSEIVDEVMVAVELVKPDSRAVSDELVVAFIIRI